jgi:hypothetical protein
MKREKISFISILIILILFSLFNSFNNYTIRNNNITEFTLFCIENDYKNVYQDQNLSLNPFDYFKRNRAQERIIWISKSKEFKSFSNYIVSVAELKDPKSGNVHFYDLKRKGNFFYFEAFGNEFDYKVAVSNAQKANLNCSIIDIWIKDNL